MSDSRAWIVERWADRLAASIESMTGERPACSVSGEAAPTEEVLWWRQKVAPVEGAAMWAATTEQSWGAVGAWILRCAGIDVAEPVDAKNTWLEVLSQAASAVVQDMGRRVATQVSCGDADTGEPPGADAVVFELEVSLPDAPWKAWVALSAALLQALDPEPQAHSAAAAPHSSDAAPAPAAAPAPKGLDLLLDIELPVSVCFGRASLPLKDVLKLTTSAIVELNRSINDPVEVIVNNRLIARGEVVVVEGNYGVRIQEIVSRESRLGSIH